MIRVTSQLFLPESSTANNGKPTIRYLSDGTTENLALDKDVKASAHTIELAIDSSTYELTAKLKDADGNIISTSNVIDLPIESMIINVSYANCVLTLTLQNGQTIEVDISDIISGLVNDVKVNGVSVVNADGEAIFTVDTTPTGNSVNLVTSGGVYNALQGKQDALTFDNAPTKNSNNPVKSGGVYNATFARVYREYSDLGITLSSSTTMQDICSAMVSNSEAYLRKYSTEGEVDLSTKFPTSTGSLHVLKYSNSRVSLEYFADTRPVEKYIGYYDTNLTPNFSGWQKIAQADTQSNENLFENPDFSIFFTNETQTSGFPCAGWQLYGAGSGQTLSYNPVTKVLTIGTQDSSGYYGGLRQWLYKPYLYKGQTMTFSATILTYTHDWLLQVWRYRTLSSGAELVVATSYSKNYSKTLTFTMPSDLTEDDRIAFLIQTRGVLGFDHAKLEFGSVETEFVPPKRSERQWNSTEYISSVVELGLTPPTTTLSILNAIYTLVSKSYMSQGRACTYHVALVNSNNSVITDAPDSYGMLTIDIGKDIAYGNSAIRPRIIYNCSRGNDQETASQYADRIWQGQVTRVSGDTPFRAIRWRELGLDCLCTTASGTAAKYATCPKYTLRNGNMIPVYFVNDNTVANATLNINNTGAKSIYVDGYPATASNLTAGWHTFTYDGSVYQTDVYSRPNIVTNAAFNINTAGGSGYGTTGSAFECVNGWFLANNIKAEILQSDIVGVDGASKGTLRIGINTSTQNGWGNIYQRFPWKRFAGKTITASLLFNASKLLTVTMTTGQIMPSASGNMATSSTIDGINLRFYFDATTEEIELSIDITGSVPTTNSDWTYLRKAKLEFGDTATAILDPNPEEELWKSMGVSRTIPTIENASDRKVLTEKAVVQKIEQFPQYGNEFVLVKDYRQQFDSTLNISGGTYQFLVNAPRYFGSGDLDVTVVNLYVNPGDNSGINIYRTTPIFYTYQSGSTYNTYPLFIERRSTSVLRIVDATGNDNYAQPIQIYMRKVSSY